MVKDDWRVTAMIRLFGVDGGGCATADGRPGSARREQSGTCGRRATSWVVNSTGSRRAAARWTSAVTKGPGRPSASRSRTKFSGDHRQWSSSEEFGVVDQYALALQLDPAAVHEIRQRLVDCLP
jgi:hypothetical protein